ncbi:peptidylprolyl isomerase [Williamwhitmania taraxaci]|uniref:Periplasmic chaperone for outer membrane proteins SurA n=1 Tax=Williamwhitmania taraxaci TaxID=1640674 RepID=A0A1G6M5D9_9BACT|nr:peptidylprolyl isomerase [Williamwhitmania taraxaci]SDC50534.1 periplasmic chaperone for outer membrane proteins SurA [Williamwhitmania taraxaci]
MNKVTKVLVSSCFALALLSTAAIAVAQKVSVDQVVAVVGSDAILLSEIEQEVMQMRAEGLPVNETSRCTILENMMIQKILLNQARIDSIIPNMAQVESQLEQRLAFFSNQLGSQKAVEEYFKKSIYDIKADLKESLRDQIQTQQMQSKVSEKVTITPSEVKAFYKQMPSDSLPMINQQYEILQIVKTPSAASQAKFNVKEKLLELRQRIVDGEKFSSLAILYSEDPGSARRGGELGFRSRGELVKPFADAGFNLKPGQVSQIVESEYGYHIIQLIEKKDDKVNVRHILMKVKFAPGEEMEAIRSLDSIATAIRHDSITFARAAMKYSDDKNTKVNGGLLVNSQAGSSKFEKDQLMPADYFALKELKEGEISSAFESRDETANVVYKIVSVKRILPAHKANIKDDYDVIQGIALRKLQQEFFLKWLDQKKKGMFIRIDPQFAKCDFKGEGWVK